MRPPWALAEEAFIDRCTRCGDCLKACPTGILAAGDGGYPSVDFKHGECTFCGDCAQACQPKAILRNEEAPTWPYRAHIAPSCLAERRIECRVCGDYCADNAIRFSPQLGACPIPEIDANRCTGCGACSAPCPANAIAIG